MNEVNTLTCKRCNGELAADARVCRRCHKLVHEETLQQLSQDAREWEAKSDFTQARNLWLQALELLPADAKQANWIAERVRQLETAASSAEQQPTQAATQRTNPAAATNVMFIVTLGAFLALYWSAYGMKFALGLTAQILLHEFGHYIDIRRRGLPADMPLFLPGLGAFVRWRAMGVSLQTRAEVSLAGPLAGWFGAAVCAWIWMQTGDAFWSAQTRMGAWINLMNLIPVWALDGGQACLALDKKQRIVVLAAALILGSFAGERLFLLVAGGAAYRLFTKDVPAQASSSSALYFVMLLIAFAVLRWMVPGMDFGFG